MFIPLGNHYWAKQNRENYFIFNSFNGEPFVVTSDIFINIQNKQISESLRRNLEEVGYFLDDRLYELNIAKTKNYLKNYDGPVVLDLILSESCNLSCHMCSHAKATEQTEIRNISKKLMNLDTAKLWIDYYVDYYPNIKKLNRYSFHFGAAEPLINKKVFLEVLSYINEKTKDKDLEVEQLINTNLTLLDDEVIEYLVKYNVKVSVGLDGLQEQNDSIRIDKKGNGTFKIIFTNIKKLIEKGGSVGVALTMTERNFDKISATEFLTSMKNLGIKTVLVDSDFIHRIKFSAEDVTQKLVDFYRLGDKMGIEIVGSWRTPFSNMTTENNNEPKSFCTSLLGKNLTITPSKCLTFCTYSGTPISFYNLEEIDKSVHLFIEQIKELMKNQLPTQNKHCINCVVSGFCSGGCYLTYEVTKEHYTMCDIYIGATSKLIDYKFETEYQFADT